MVNFLPEIAITATMIIAVTINLYPAEKPSVLSINTNRNINSEPVPVATDFDKPNSPAFSRDETRLYVSDTGLSHAPDGPHHIRVFDVRGNQLVGGEVFAEIEHGVSDGFRGDELGNL